MIASYVQAQEVVVEFSDAAWAFDSRRAKLITTHRAIRAAWQQMSSKLRLAGVYYLAGPMHSETFLRGLPVASLHWFLTEFMQLCELLLPHIPCEHALAQTIRQTRAACAPTLNPHSNAKRIRVLRDLWTVSVLITALIRRELRILSCTMRGICMLIRDAAVLHTSLFAPELGKLWWSTCFPQPSKFAASWREAATLEPFPAADTPMRTNCKFVPEADYFEYVSSFQGTPHLAKVLHKHWRHHANWPAHGHMLSLHDYWDSLFEIDDETIGAVHPLSFHTIGVEARMLVLILGAPPDYWFSEVPYQRFPETAHQDEEAPEEDDSWVPWADPPLPPSPFLLPYRPGALFYADVAELRRAVSIGRASGRALGWAGGWDE